MPGYRWAFKIGRTVVNAIDFCVFRHYVLMYRWFEFFQQSLVRVIRVVMEDNATQTRSASKENVSVELVF